MGAWIFFDLALLAAGAISILMSILWKRPDLMTNMVIDNTDLTGQLVTSYFHGYPLTPLPQPAWSWEYS